MLAEQGSLALGFAWYVIFIGSVVLHEAAHAFASWKLGDPTAYLGGQVSLDPIPHIRREPIGMVAVPVVSYMLSGFMLGWASAPYNPLWAQQYPKRSAIMALAGPAANLLLILCAALLIHVGMFCDIFYVPEEIHLTQVTVAYSEGFADGVAKFLSIVFSLNLILFLFNLLPFPPLDGSGAIPIFLSNEGARRYMEVMRQPMVSLLGIVVAWNLFPKIYGPLLSLAVNVLYPGSDYQ